MGESSTQSRGRLVTVVSIVEAVTSDLRGRVLRGELAPSSSLAEVDVAQSYGVARPTAKAAIETLVHERLLRRTAHKTARVVALTAADVHDIYLTRGFIEIEVVRRLALHGHVPAEARKLNDKIFALRDASPDEIVAPDVAFHRTLVDAIESPRASELYRSLASEVLLCMTQVQGAALLSTDQIATEHDRILKSIERRDAATAARLVTKHINGASVRLQRLLDEGNAQRRR